MLWRNLLILIAIASVVSAKKAHRHHEKKHFSKDTDSGDDVFDILASDEADEKRKKKDEFELENVIEDSDKKPEIEDPCLKHRCGPGKVCERDENGDPKCVCIETCPEELDERRKVCSNHNETWASDCELYRMRCMCTQDMEGCKLSKYKHVHIDYYGACKDIGECTDDEMEDFPRRMREWLFNVMQDLARREELKGLTLELEREAERRQSRKWVNAVIWKFCDLDVHPHDRKVSRHELFPIRAPLMAMEHCIAPFLDGCDADDDHMITLHEWGQCLGLDNDEIEDKCALIHKNRSG